MTVEKDGGGPIRRMVCPFCGHTCLFGGIGEIQCGPHKLKDGRYTPAVYMIEADALAVTINGD